MDMVNEAKNFGIETSGGKLDWKFLKESRDTYITRLNGIYERNLGNSGVQIIQGVSARAFGMSLFVSRGGSKSGCKFCVKTYDKLT